VQTCLIIGGGIIGTMHAWFAQKEGFDVIQLERSELPNQASVRNFGLVWVSGRSSGAELNLALRARELWGEISHLVPNTGFRPHGSLTLARTAPELEVILKASQMQDASERKFEFLTGDQVRILEPNISEKILGALKCESDAIVEPAHVLGALREYLSRQSNYTWVNNIEICDFRILQDSCEFISDDGRRFTSDHAIIAPGADHFGAFRQLFEGAEIRRVRLQMAAIDGRAIKLRHSLADGDSLRYYPAFKDCGLDTLPPQNPIAKKFGMQLLLTQRLDGSLTIGDTHEYQEPFSEFLNEEPYEYLKSVVLDILNIDASFIRKWDGIYSQMTNEEIYFRRVITPRVHLVSGGGGRGNTLSPAIAEETFQLWKEMG
jgi:FAD dependent oxidoreductase TIGR03364